MHRATEVVEFVSANLLVDQRRETRMGDDDALRSAGRSRRVDDVRGVSVRIGDVRSESRIRVSLTSSRSSDATASSVSVRTAPESVSMCSIRSAG